MPNSEYIKGVKYRANDSYGICHITRGDIITVDPSKGSIETVNGKLCKSNSYYLFPRLSEKLWIPINSNKSNKMAAKKKTTGIVLKDGQYYTAVVNRKKIRGKVWENGSSEVYLLNNQSVGDECCDFDDDSDFSYGVLIEKRYNSDKGEYEFTQESLDDAEVSSITIVTDRRIKKVIDSDILPETAGYKVRKNEDGTYVFGCGAVKVTKTELEQFIKYRKALDALNSSAEATTYNNLLESYKDETNEEDFPSNIAKQAEVLLKS